MNTVLGQPSGEPTVHVADASRRGRVKRGDGDVERVDQCAMLARQLGKRIAARDDELKAAPNHVVEPPLAAGSAHQALNAQGARERV